MKRFVTTLAALALTTPSIASADSAAKALSLNNAAAHQPVRATAPMAKKKMKAVENHAILIGASILIIAGVVCVIACDSKGKDSP
jgi:hypothetical protein